MRNIVFLLIAALIISCDEDSASPNPTPDENEYKLYINELMSQNESSLQDSHGEYDDWIEIYNGADTAIDLGGYYLTDDFTNPELYMIPTADSEETTIQPGEYLVLWADKNTEQGVLHLELKLSKDGEQLGLYKKEGENMTKIDGVEFPALDADKTYGRSPDGGSSWKTYNTPTPGAANN